MDKDIYIIIILVIMFIVFLNQSSNSNGNGNGNGNGIKIKKLIRQTARWATAAQQDINPYIINLHATYALGYLMALREIYTDEEIKIESGVDVRKLEMEITNTMDNAIKELVKICPEGQPKNRYLAYLSKEGGVYKLNK